MRQPVLLGTSDLAARRILIVAPHPDDEALGCGGMIAMLAPHGRHFHVVFTTDGGASHKGSATWSRERLSAQREDEAAEAMKILGIGDHERSFLRLPDAAMPGLKTPAGGKALAKFRAILRNLMPDLVLLPWRRDPHCDHRDSWTLARVALAAEGQTPATLEYAVWLDEIGAPDDYPTPDEAEPVALDITSSVAAKRAAVMAHLSQTTGLIADDPTAFRLTPETIDRLTGPLETYWRPLS